MRCHESVERVMAAMDRVPFWVFDLDLADDTVERLGETRRAAGDERVGALVVTSQPIDTDAMIAHGADTVLVFHSARVGPRTRLAAALMIWKHHQPTLALMGADADNRSWAAGLAAATEAMLISPALMVQRTAGELEIAALDRSGKLSRQIRVSSEQSAVVTMRCGVAEPLQPDSGRIGRKHVFEWSGQNESIIRTRRIPADPAKVDIRDADRLVAGGRGLGSARGFELLQRLASHLDAGVAASRMAVDLGWIDRERQVGQTGKSVQPQLYIACGISGASHHLEGMSTAEHIVAVNTDPSAPIFSVAHLGLVADLHDILARTCQALEQS
ncbi:MAG: hypothetical protein CMJ18_15345 [Phycisphaeraceae bacterium]|nr:hypothetical protein [Phycisphaeraceae bacterium]